ncbi:hypothetical protein SLEP1_g49587 [Rubroshorea leprosula]|uniref:Uncharacterized protein n=1 Tax=Rubroshorea leprosula TaxID=152421 RepID=A0AAV5LY38_9ROSI|nr:hypothetical protein SLEP1_g49587 [Rubroshorea leprosula]
MSAHVDMLFVTPLVGEVTNASTCRHVRDRTGSLMALLVGIIH